jgi:Lrp/AsnC family transcriptional regulator, leucine-responsive regulatory protein
MNKLSEIDKKIIYELTKDARQSYKQIARSIKSKKEIVSYHITQLINKGIITKFVPVIALTKLNIYSFKIYLKLHGLTKQKEKELYSYLLNSKQVAWVAKCVGAWDLLIGFYGKDIVSFSRIKNELLSHFSHNITEYNINMIEDALVFNRDYLRNKSVDYRKQFVFGGEIAKFGIQEDELQLLHLIRNKGRFNLRDIADKMNVDSRTILNKIKKLEKLEIIQGYTTFLDLQKIGYQLHKLCLHFSQHSKKEITKVINYCKQKHSIIHIIQVLGSWELELEMESNNLEDVYEYITELKNFFPETIKRIDLVTIKEEAKLEFFPEDRALLQAMKN